MLVFMVIKNSIVFFAKWHLQQRQEVEGHISDVHENKREFKCEICSAAFNSKGRLNLHMIVHDNKRDFSCSICSKCFKRKDNLKNHIATHDQIEISMSKMLETFEK